MKPDEKSLRDLVVARGLEPAPTVRELGARLGMHRKRVNAICEKWIRQGWYECGIAVDMGWVSDPEKITD